MARTVIVSNRLPVSVVESNGKLEVYPSAGGLATGLSSYANRKGNLWIGWPGIISDGLSEKNKRFIARKLATYNCQPVFLTRRQVEMYYNGFSNSILWPLFHQLKPDLSKIDTRWKAYQQVNKLFSEAVLALSNPGSTIWIHDYQLMLLPSMLRQHRPVDKIGFFLHITFPPVKKFVKLKHAGTLIRGVLGADLVGFHTKEYVKNFLDSCAELTQVGPIKQGVALKDRAVRVADFPMGIDYIKFTSGIRALATQREASKLRARYMGKKIILTVDRLDPTKGFLERLRAYHTFLKTSPSLHGKVVMLMLAVPSRGEIEAYKKLKKDIESQVKKINREFGSPTWQPIEYMYKSVGFEELSALYKVADVAFVAPLRDGMNLVAKEYIASQGRKKGMLILSQTAGAAKELRDALLVDHSRPNTLVTALTRALTMQPAELKRRVNAMQKTLSLNTVYDWAGEFMGALNKPVHFKTTPHLTKIRQENLVRNYRGQNSRLLIFDYDGVLTPFMDNPAHSKPTPDILKLLRRLSADKQNTVAIISGRSQKDLQAWFGRLPIFLIAEHGAAIRKPRKDWKQLAPQNKRWKSAIKPILEKFADDTPGAFVEEKNYALVWHYRKASPYYAQKNIAFIKATLKPLLKRYGIKLFMGSKILEIKDPTITKGTAIKHLMKQPFDFMLAIGDDYTDEDMFKALPRRAFTLKVGQGATKARYRVQDPGSVQKLLTRL